MLIFFAGGEAEDFSKALVEGGARNCLESFWGLNLTKPLHHDRFKNHLLDSGGFSARQRGVEIDVKRYAEYLNRYKVKFAFNLDVKDLDKSLANQKFLEENTGSYIIPIYHAPEWTSESTRDILDYYVEFYPYIGLGGIAGRETGPDNLERFLNYVFRRTKDKTWVHGLGISRKSLLYKYPFATCDSTSWISVLRFGNSGTVSDKMSKVQRGTRSIVERLRQEVPTWFKMEDECTRLWQARGVVWGDLDFEQMMSKRAKIIPTYKEWKDARV